MDIKPLKTVRFTKLVEESGEPVPVTLWTEPEEDRDFAKAMREGRVLTVVQRNVGARADYGLVGFFKEPLAMYLLFPKKLAHPEETKVIGIKYEQLAETKPKGPLHKPKAHEPTRIRMREIVTLPRAQPLGERPSSKTRDRKSGKPEPKAPAPPKLHRFRANVEITTRQLVPVEVEATSVKVAARLVKEKVQQLQPDLRSATIKKRTSATTKV